MKKCAAGQNKVKFWLNQPNITKFSDVSKFDCQYVFGDRVEKSVCTDRFPCGICKLPPNKLTLIKGLSLLSLGVKIQNLQVDFKTGGTWRRVGQLTLIMNIYDFFYSTYSFSCKMPAYKQNSRRWKIFVYMPVFWD